MLNMFLSIPSSFDLFGLKVNFYGLITALSYIAGILITCLLAKKRGFKGEDIITLACYVVPFAIIGARVYYVLFKLENYTNFWDVFKIWEGGLAFYGGLIGGAIAVLLYCKIHKKNFFALLDIIAPALIFAQALGRWGNFFNQEAFGIVIKNPSLQWFPFAVFIDRTQQWHAATFFYESMWNLITFAVLIVLLYKCKFKHNGIIASFYLLLYGIGRLWIEGLRTDSLYIGNIRISQLLSIIFVIIGATTIIYSFMQKKKKKDSFDIIMEAIKKS
ncbi:MAG: prolipoprotein diacylglyceryl transferase [Clostridia bacterium]|nr:prolipoprotein diacylglyceryl transferase [Clostridia bacterium]